MGKTVLVFCCVLFACAGLPGALLGAASAPVEKERLESRLSWENGGRLNIGELQKAHAQFMKQAARSLASEDHVLLGVSFSMQGAADKAMLEYSRALKLNASDPVAAVARGDVYWAKKLWNDALRSYHAVVFRLPHPMAYGRMIEAYEKRGQPGEAAKNIQKWLSLDPENPTAHLKLGAWYERTGKTQDAIKEYDKITQGSAEFYAANRAKKKLGVSQGGADLDERKMFAAPLVYERKNRRDPFEPYTKGINAYPVDIKMFELTAIVKSERSTSALFKNKSKPWAIYILKNGKVVTRDNVRIIGVTGIIEDKDVILTQGDSEIHFKLPEGGDE